MSFTGPQGFTGPTGPTGPRGAPGLTLGVTGNTGAYVIDTISDLNANTITFLLSNGRTIGPIFGFTGSGTVISDSRGISSTISNDYKSFFLGVCGGKTFEFAGLCGDGRIVNVELSPDKKQIHLIISNITGGVSYGETADNYLLYNDPSGNVSKTDIAVFPAINPLFEDNSPSFYNLLANQNVFLEMGFTKGVGVAGPTAGQIANYVDLDETYLSIPSIARGENPGILPAGISGIDSGGYILNLNKTSVFHLTSPLGITAFHLAGQIAKNNQGSWLFFINGSDVWNLPDNLYFSAGLTTGIGGFGFCQGMNILRVHSYHDGTSFKFYGTFVDRCLTSTPNLESRWDKQYGGYGSCCLSNGECKEFITQEECETTWNGTFNSLRSCEESCNVGSCCMYDNDTGSNTCFDNVSKTVCEAFAGSWDPSNCFIAYNGPGQACVPSQAYFNIAKQNTTEPVRVTNNASVNAPEKIGQITISTNSSTGCIIKMPSQISAAVNAPYGKFTFKPAPPYDDINPVTGYTEKTYSTPIPTGTVLDIYFLNDIDGQQTVFREPLLPFELNVQIYDNSSVPQDGVTFSVRPRFYESCGTGQRGIKIRTAFKLDRYCDDCFVLREDIEGDGPERGFYPVQQQYGTFDYCLDPDTGTRTTICADAGQVLHINGCTLTHFGAQGETDARCGGGATLYHMCVHAEHEWNVDSRGATIPRCWDLDPSETGDVNKLSTTDYNRKFCCAACFSPEKNPASPNYGYCLYDPNTSGNAEYCNSLYSTYSDGSPGFYPSFYGWPILNPGDRLDFASVCYGDFNIDLYYIGGAKVVRTYDLGGFQGTTLTYRGNQQEVDPRYGTSNVYSVNVGFYPDERAVMAQLWAAGVTTEAGISAEIGWIKDSIISSQVGGKNTFFTQQNENVNHILNAQGVTCCSYDEYVGVDPNGSIRKVYLDDNLPAGFDPAQYEVKYIVAPGLSSHTYDTLFGNKQTIYYNGKIVEFVLCQGRPAWSMYRLKTERLIIKVVWDKTKNKIVFDAAKYSPCVIDSISLIQECNWYGVFYKRGGGCSVTFVSPFRGEIIWPTDMPIRLQLIPSTAVSTEAETGKKYIQVQRYRSVEPFSNEDDKSWIRKIGLNPWWYDLNPGCADPTEWILGNIGDEWRHADIHPEYKGKFNAKCTLRGSAVACHNDTILGLVGDDTLLPYDPLEALEIDDYIYKPRYCPCNITSDAKLCDSPDYCVLPATTCTLALPWAAQNTTVLGQNCGEQPSTYTLFFLQENTANPDRSKIYPKVIKVDKASRTVTYETRTLLYSTGRLTSYNDDSIENWKSLTSESPADEFAPALQRYTTTGKDDFTSAITVNTDHTSGYPVGEIYIYLLDQPASEDSNNFYTGRTGPIFKKIKVDPTQYNDGHPTNPIVYVHDSLPGIVASIAVPIDHGNGTFSLKLSLDTVSSVAPITDNGWIITDYAYNLWSPLQTGYLQVNQGYVGNYSTVPSNNYNLVGQNILGPFNYADFSTTNYSDNEYINIEIITSYIVKKYLYNSDGTFNTGKGYQYRILEGTHTVKILRPGVVPTRGIVTQTQNKKIEVNGESICVSIDCSVYGSDCLGLGDC